MVSNSDLKSDNNLLPLHDYFSKYISREIFFKISMLSENKFNFTTVAIIALVLVLLVTSRVKNKRAAIFYRNSKKSQREKLFN